MAHGAWPSSHLRDLSSPPALARSLIHEQLTAECRRGLSRWRMAVRFPLLARALANNPTKCRTVRCRCWRSHSTTEPGSIKRIPLVLEGRLVSGVQMLRWAKQAVSFLPFRVRTFGQHPGRQQLLEPATPHRARMPWLHEPIVTIPTATAFLCWFCLPSPLPSPAPYKTTQYMHTDRTSPKNVFAREEKRTPHCRNAKWQPLPFNTSHSLRPGVKNLRAGQICCFPHASTTILRF